LCICFGQRQCASGQLPKSQSSTGFSPGKPEMRIFFAVILIGHGFAHLAGFLLPWRFAGLIEKRLWLRTRLLACYHLRPETRALLANLCFSGAHRLRIFSCPIFLSLRAPFDKPNRWPLNTTDDTLRPRIPAISALLLVR